VGAVTGLVLALALFTLPDGVVWHEEAAGKYRIGLGGGIEDRSVSSADRKAMLAGLEPWVQLLKRSLPPRGMDVLINKSAPGGSKAKNGPYYMDVDVMLFWYLSYPRAPGRAEPEDETGKSIYLRINSTYPLGDNLVSLGRGPRGGDLFLAPRVAGIRQGFTEYELNGSARALLLGPPGVDLFVPVSNTELYETIKAKLTEKAAQQREAAQSGNRFAVANLADFEQTLARLEADYAGLPPQARAAAAVSATGRDLWPGFFPRGAQPVVKYNSAFFRTRTRRTEPHFAMVWWQWSHLDSSQQPWMTKVVDEIDWRQFQLLLAK
jgi:hypothetical protein